MLVAELAEVIARRKFLGRIRNAGLTAKQLVQNYAGLAEIVEPAALLAPASRDPDDDHVLACALAAEANFIVSGDGDLLSLGDFRGIRILTAREALAVIA